MFLQRLVVVVFGLASAYAQARDLSLPEAEKLLAERGRELISARRSLEIAGAQREIAAARPNAILSLNSTAISNKYNSGPGTANTTRADTVLRIDQPFERGNKRELRMDAAETLEQAVRGDSLDVLRSQLAQLRGSYYELKQAEEKQAILGETAQLFGRTLAAAQARLKAGDLAASEVSRIQVDHERAQNDARNAQADLVRARLALAYMIGEERRIGGEMRDLRASDPWPERIKLDPSEVERAIEKYVELRPDVAAARARAAAAEKLRDLAKSQQTRDVTLGAQYERYPGTVPADSIGFGIAVPLFTGNNFSGDIRRAEVERYAALDALDRARALAGNDIRRAASDLASATERLERYDSTLLESAARTSQAAEFAFQRGATSVLEVLDSRRTLRAVRLEALAARTDHAKALAAWRASQTTMESLGEK
jgi:cobalt-zinc-cadmium efflux system outer membrane protein